MPTSEKTLVLEIDGAGPVELTVTERGDGAAWLLLHGGGGPQTVTPFADLLATSGARVVVPVHPGFANTRRPDGLSAVQQLAQLYVELLDELGLSDVTIAGNSLGGWIAAEIALLHSPRVTGLVLIDGVGIEVTDHPIADFFSIPPDQLSKYSFYDADKFRIDPAALPPAVARALPGNRASLAAYAGTTMADPSLFGRLAGITVPALVLWGDADRIVDADYGRAFAAAIPGARFQLLTATGHLPQVETPEAVLDALTGFTAARTADGEDGQRWSTEYSTETDMAPDAIWASIRALRTGAIPSANGDRFELNGPFAAGSVILASPEGLGLTLEARIIELAENRTYAEETAFSGLTLQHHYRISHPDGTGTRITHDLVVTGPGASEAGPRIAADYPEAMAEVIDVARRNFSSPA